MEKLIMNALLDMYANGELGEIVDADEAYSEKNTIIAKLKDDTCRYREDLALDNAICAAITEGLNHGFFDGVKVGLAMANAFTPKTDIAFIQKVSKAVSA